MVSQCTKFEVSRFTRYEAMNGTAKCRKWGGLGWLGGTQGGPGQLPSLLPPLNPALLQGHSLRTFFSNGVFLRVVCSS